MALNRPTGLSPAFSLRREIDRLFDDAFGGSGLFASGTTWRPPVDIEENDRELCLALEVPGIEPGQIDINVENGVLTVRGEKTTERKEGEEDSRYHVIERSYGSFYRSFQLPQGVDEGQIQAEHKNGVLIIRIPKTALPQPRRIQIKAGQSTGQPSVTSGEVSGGRGGRRVEAGRTEQRGERERKVAGSPEGGNPRQGASGKRE
jgi:HSP20 family protein